MRRFSADSRYSNGNQLCPSSSRHKLFLYSYMKQNLCSLYSQPTRNSWHVGSISHIGTSIGLSINNPQFANYLGQMYPIDFEIRYMTESNTSASHLDLLLSIGRDGGQLHSSIYDKHDDFSFHITSFSFLSSKIPASPAHGKYFGDLVRRGKLDGDILVHVVSLAVVSLVDVCCSIGWGA